jgi:hypothetical protein
MNRRAVDFSDLEPAARDRGSEVVSVAAVAMTAAASSSSPHLVATSVAEGATALAVSANTTLAVGSCSAFVGRLTMPRSSRLAPSIRTPSD